MPADPTPAPLRCPDAATLAGFVSGRLADPDLEVVADHLSTCDQCAAAVRTLDRDSSGPFTDRVRRSLLSPEPSAELGYLALAAAAKGLWQEDFDLDQSTVSRTGPATAATPADTVAGVKVGPYVVRRVLGRGGMGVVYLAEHEAVKQVVALKMILAGEHARPDAVERFRREAEAAARLDHPNIVRLLNFSEHNGLPYFAMEYVPGTDLAERLKHAGPLPPRAAAELVRTLAGAVGYAHGRGVVHRDLKPANVLLSSVTGRLWGKAPDLPPAEDEGSSLQLQLHARQSVHTPKITDFGLAKLLDADGDGMTVSNVIVGTPSYMAPEQAAEKGAVIGPATDVYALGAILYACLTGKPPFAGADKRQTVDLVRSAKLVPPSRVKPGLPAELEAICLKCLARVPLSRYAGGDELATDLGRWLAGERTVARPPGWVRRHRRGLVRAAVAAGLLAVAGGVLAAVRAVPIPPSIVRPLEPLPAEAVEALRAVLGGVGATRVSVRLARESPNADQVAQRLGRELDAGRKVTLIGETGPPAYHRIIAGDRETSLTLGADGVFTVQSSGPEAYVELFPSVALKSYLFRAEVRHTVGPRYAACVGAYVGHHKNLRPSGGQVLLVITFNDTRLLASAREKGVDIPRLKETMRDQVHFNHVWGDTVDKKLVPRVSCSFYPHRWLTFFPQCSDDNAFRVLEFRVTPRDITATFDGQPIGEPVPTVLFAEVVDAAAHQRRVVTDNSVVLPIPASQPCVGGVGLTLVSGTTQFRSVTLSPLGDAIKEVP